MIEDMTSHVRALLDYFESQDLNANEVLVICSFVAGMGAGQASGDNVFHRRQLNKSIQEIAEEGAETVDAIDAEGITAIRGNGRWFEYG